MRYSAPGYYSASIPGALNCKIISLIYREIGPEIVSRMIKKADRKRLEAL